MIVPRLPTDLNSLLLFVFIYIFLSTCLVFIINYYDNRTGSNYNHNNNNVDEENTKDYQRRRINRDCRIVGSCSRPSKSRFCCQICCNFSNYRCSRCRQVRYCSETCQIKHWRSGHRIECNEFKSVGVSNPSSSSGRRPPDTVHEHTNKNENSNGGIQPTKKISNKEVENVKECLICLSIIHTSKTSRPSVTCHTCKQTFHLDCLSKWYSVSKGSNCPQCRSPLQIR